MPSLTTLPREIIDLVLPLINLKDYVSCVRVNKEWYTLFTPLLWRDIRVVDETINERFKTIEARRALVRNAQHLRTVETTDPALVYCLGSCMPPTINLQSLTIRFKNHPVSTVTELVISDNIVLKPGQFTGDETRETMDIRRCAEEVIRLVHNNSDLQYLSLDVGCFRYKDGKEGFPDLVVTIPTAKLEKLELSFLQSIPFDRDINSINDVELDMKQYHLTKHAPFLALKEVVITGGSQNFIDPNPLFFLIRCPNMETLRLHRLDDKALQTIPLFVGLACHKLVNLEWRKSVYDDEDVIVRLIRLTKLGWKELRLPDMPMFGTDALEAVMEHAETLEVFRFESSDVDEIQENAFLDLLCSARNLRRLEGIVDRQRKRFTTEVMVHAQAAYLEHFNGGRDRSWVLGPSMKHLQLRIEGVPRPDVVCRLNGSELMFQQTGLDPTLRFDVQRWIYAQLGRMTGLEVLILGLQDLSIGTMKFAGVDSSMDLVAMEEAALLHGIRMFNYQSLEFSLESGLSLLAGLKELRVLDVRSTAHYIGIAELEWMQRNWPKLETIIGLESDRRWSVHHADGLAAKGAVESWMNSYPRGIGSSFYL
ncbi:hypothetical protein EC957_006946 [Mortierella hygrophila]|uniref:F-box domain-containing protein n=1 Tax=Mortierella hygrophila TaxID=979708 RepID=A0A9P6EZ61_9FUNG|nr:hypothetical protein EC957_006946 [Mortierella hygrophila]